MSLEDRTADADMQPVSINSIILNKHCRIPVSGLDKERNRIQAHETAYKLMELHVSLRNCMQAHGFMEPHASFLN